MKIKRTFIVGEEWLYFKVYTGPNLAEELLFTEIKEVVRKLYQSQTIDKFFFIRFVDESYHLRLRFRLTNTIETGFVIQALSERLQVYVENRLVSKVIIDTYNRELERYGSNSIEDVETLFSINSWQIMDGLSQLDTSEDENAGWLWGIKSIDTVLDKLGLTIEKKHDLYESNFQKYSMEFGNEKSTRIYLQSKYREHRKQIETAILAPLPAFTEAVYHPVSEEELDRVINNLINLREESLLEIEFEHLLYSIVHMHFNRIFRTKQRAHEFVIYYMLSCFYKSMKARLHKNTVSLSARL